jgi:hypothetical protein
MADKGFAHAERELDCGEWEVLFTPETESARTPPPSAEAHDDWPEPKLQLDNRDLDPPEPMVRILGAAETLGQARRSPRCCAESRYSSSRNWRSAATDGSAASRATDRPTN